ncbi:hypothetical protein BV20DRAFT_1052185 [Pilatotrama ljubarskyi]|nr:hypothetical protein BV20DRAFT_1052185 [Pilatotrama ljubarskyi]
MSLSRRTTPAASSRAFTPSISGSSELSSTTGRTPAPDPPPADKILERALQEGEVWMNKILACYAVCAKGAPQYSKNEAIWYGLMHALNAYYLQTLVKLPMSSRYAATLVFPQLPVLKYNHQRPTALTQSFEEPGWASIIEIYVETAGSPQLTPGPTQPSASISSASTGTGSESESSAVIAMKIFGPNALQEMLKAVSRRIPDSTITTADQAAHVFSANYKDTKMSVVLAQIALGGQFRVEPFCRARLRAMNLLPLAVAGQQEKEADLSKASAAMELAKQFEWHALEATNVTARSDQVPAVLSTISLTNQKNRASTFNRIELALVQINEDFYKNIGDDVRQPLRMLEHVARMTQPDFDYTLGDYSPA